MLNAENGQMPQLTWYQGLCAMFGIQTFPVSPAEFWMDIPLSLTTSIADKTKWNDFYAVYAPALSVDERVKAYTISVPNYIFFSRNEKVNLQDKIMAELNPEDKRNTNMNPAIRAGLEDLKQCYKVQLARISEEVAAKYRAQQFASGRFTDGNRKVHTNGSLYLDVKYMCEFAERFAERMGLKVTKDIVKIQKSANRHKDNLTREHLINETGLDVDGRGNIFVTMVELKNVKARVNLMSSSLTCLKHKSWTAASSAGLELKLYKGVNLNTIVDAMIRADTEKYYGIKASPSAAIVTLLRNVTVTPKDNKFEHPSCEDGIPYKLDRFKRLLKRGIDAYLEKMGIMQVQQVDQKMDNQLVSTNVNINKAN